MKVHSTAQLKEQLSCSCSVDEGPIKNSEPVVCLNACIALVHRLCVFACVCGWVGGWVGRGVWVGVTLGHLAL